MTLVNWAVSHASLSWTHSSAKTKYDLFLNKITLSGLGRCCLLKHLHELPVGLTSLYIRIHGEEFPKAGERQSRSDQQHTRQTNLCHHESTAHCARTCTTATRARFLAQDRRQFDLRQMRNRYKADQDAGHNRCGERKLR